jgi:hypothetical protein
MENIVIIILSICIIVALLLYINSCYENKTLKKELNQYKESKLKLEEMENTGRAIIPVVYNNKTYYIYQDSNMMEAIKLMGIKPETTYYDRTPNGKFTVSYIEYYNHITHTRLILSFENNVFRSAKAS